MRARHVVARREGVTVSSRNLSVRVEPDRGMTLVSLIAGRELLWATDPAPDSAIRALGEPGRSSGERLEAVLQGGWFEMTPNAGLPHRPDRPAAYFHGEAVRRSWRVVSHSATHLEAELRLSSEPIALRRRVEVQLDTVVVASELQNLGSDSRPVSPGEHPCFRRDVFAGGSLTVRGRPLGPAAVPGTIPVHADGTSGNAAVGLTDPAVILTAVDGLQVRMRVDLDSHRDLGIWWNYSRGDGVGIDAWDTIALEPLTRFQDEVLLAPGATYSSRTIVEVRAATSPERTAAGQAL